MKQIYMETYIKLKTAENLRSRLLYGLPTLIREAMSDEYRKSKVRVDVLCFSVTQIEFKYVGDAYKITSVYDGAVKCFIEEWKESCISIIKNIKENLQIWEEIPIRFIEAECEKVVLWELNGKVKSFTFALPFFL